MPIIQSAVKNLRKTARRTERNTAAQSRLRTALRRVRTPLTQKKRAEAEAAFAAALPLIDRAAAKGFIHKNAAARYKSRLAQQINALPT